MFNEWLRADLEQTREILFELTEINIVGTDSLSFGGNLRGQLFEFDGAIKPTCSSLVIPHVRKMGKTEIPEDTGVPTTLYASVKSRVFHRLLIGFMCMDCLYSLLEMVLSGMCQEIVDVFCL